VAADLGPPRGTVRVSLFRRAGEPQSRNGDGVNNGEVRNPRPAGR